MYDYGLTLIGVTGYQRDANGNYLSQGETRTEILCDVKSVTRSEFYSAAQAGLNPEQVFEVNGFEYAGQQEVEFEGERYTVIRAYRIPPVYEKLELTCERKAKNG